MTASLIRVLSDQLINKIAAGEVVERPASVFKELIENALDAGATQIEASVVAGGKRLIKISDNAAGMSRDDALLSIERYATSKIASASDIEHIATLGFRGEALAAISAVARFSLRTRRAVDLAGTELNMAGGKILEVRELGCPPGTTVEVRQLFFNVPARRKFLRTEATELAHLRQVFFTYALAHPTVDMRLMVDGRPVYVLAGGGTFEDRLRELLPATAEAPLRQVDYQVAPLHIKGYVGLPANSRANRSEQYLFVNGRPASAAVLGAAIRAAYHSLLPSDRFPVVFLFLDLDPGLVDVNVHPTKKEVRFRDPNAIRAALGAALRQALAASGPFGPGGAAAPAGPSLAQTWRSRALGGPRPLVAPRDFFYPRPKSLDQPPPPPPTQLAQPAAASLAPAAPWSWCRVLGQVNNLYVVMETEDGLALMDPHAAHERVLYERYLAALAGSRVESQGLLIAETVDLSPVRAQQARQRLDLLKELGFSIAEFGADTFLVDALPACFAGVPPRLLLPDLVAALEEAGAAGGTRQLLQERIARAACRAAVKAQQTLSEQEILDLVAQLARAEMPYTCPHGRPTLIHLSFQELAKKFGRS